MVTAATGILTDWYTGIFVTGIQVDWYAGFLSDWYTDAFGVTGIQVDWYTYTQIYRWTGILVFMKHFHFVINSILFIYFVTINLLCL